MTLRALPLLIGLLTALSLWLAAPTGPAVGLHRGEPFHPLFAHQHPDDDLASADLLAAHPVRAEFQGAAPVGGFTPLALFGQQLPSGLQLSLLLLLLGSLPRTRPLRPAEELTRPLAPPPRAR